MFDWRIDTMRGKMMYSNLGSRGDPITRPRPRDLERDHGVKLHGRLIGAGEHELRFDDDSSLSADDLSIVWCTGLRADYGFIEPRRPQTRSTQTGARSTCVVSCRRRLACTSSVSGSSTPSLRTTSTESPTTLATSLNTYLDDWPAPRRM